MSVEQTPIEGVVYIPVPASRLLDVYAALSQLGVPVHATSVRPAEPQTARDFNWDAQAIYRLNREVRHPAVRAMLDLCAAKPEQWVSVLEVMKASGLKKPNVRGGLAGFTLLLKSRFGTKTWPTGWQWIDGHANYRMDRETAGFWLAANKA
jgi:hypothetical protein